MAALAAGGAQAVGEPGCPVAERTVKANGAELVSCVVHNTENGPSVTVEVGVQLHRGWELPGMPTRVVKSSRPARWSENFAQKCQGNHRRP